MAGKRRKSAETPPSDPPADEVRTEETAEDGGANAAADDGAEVADGDGTEDGADEETPPEEETPPADAPPPAPTPKAPTLPLDRPGPKGERGEDLRKRLGEPEAAAGAKVDAKTGRVEVPAPGTFDPKRRAPQRP